MSYQPSFLAGKYNEKKIDFSKLEKPKVNLTFFPPYYCTLTGCGPCAAALLTGVNPEKIHLLNKKRHHFPERLMVSFLKKNGHKIQKLNLTNLTNSMYVENSINSYHLLLTLQMYTKNQASYAVIHQMKYIIHNFEISKLDNFEFVNRPLLAAFLVY